MKTTSLATVAAPESMLEFALPDDRAVRGVDCGESAGGRVEGRRPRASGEPLKQTSIQGT